MLLAFQCVSNNNAIIISSNVKLVQHNDYCFLYLLPVLKVGLCFCNNISLPLLQSNVLLLIEHFLQCGFDTFI